MSFKVGQQSLLGYLPAIMIQNVLDDKIKANSKPPLYSSLTTVALFADISGFTKLSETFSVKGRTGSEFLAFCLNSYMVSLINIIGKNGGDIFKFAGDAIQVIWPEEPNKDYTIPCRRALQCASEIQSKLKNIEIIKGKVLNVKVGLGFGECKILLVGGQFNRFEYLIVGEAIRQACTSECHCKGGGETVISESVYKLIVESKHYEVIEAEPDLSHGPGDGLKYYNFIKSHPGSKVQTRADAFLMRTKFNVDKIRSRMGILKSFVPAAITRYLDIEKEVWSKESRLMTIMFLNLTIDLRHTKTKSGLEYIQSIINTIQRCVYRTRGSLNKFLLDDKGSVLLVVWGIPPFSAHDDPLRAVQSGMIIINALKEIQSKEYEICGAKMGITTGCAFSGVCGNIGGRREYSLLGEVVNLSARFMQKAMEMCKEQGKKFKLLICEKTMSLIQDKITCQMVARDYCKGFTNQFNFYEPMEKQEQPEILNTIIKTHRFNVVFYENDKILQHEVRDSLFIVGRNKEIEFCVKELKTVSDSQESRCILINGIIGSGKSLFIRKVLIDFFEESPILKVQLPENNENRLPFIFVTKQMPTLFTLPYNGCSQFLQDMYNILSSHGSFKDIPIKLLNGIEIKCDKFGQFLVENNAFDCINYLNEILSCNLLKKHFAYDDNLLKKIEDNIDPFKDPQRDSFFTKRKLFDQVKKLDRFFIRLVNEYRKICIPNTILILIIEDCHLVDDNTIELLNQIKELPKIFIACTYQDSFNPYEIQIPVSLNYDTVLEMKSLQSIDDCIQIIKYFCQSSKINISVKEIEYDTLLRILEHSSNNPLFLQDLIESLIHQEQLIFDKTTRILGSSEEFKKYCRTLDWSNLTIPVLAEKLVGNIIDTLRCDEIIILKHATVIGAIFDIDKLNHLNIFNNITFDELNKMINDFSNKGLLQILYDINPKKLVAKFNIPFLQEVLYKRMLVEMKNEIHLKVARLMESSKFFYLDSKIEKEILNHHLSEEEKTIIDHMEEDVNSTNKESGMTRVIYKEDNLKIRIMKNLIQKLKEIDLKIESNDSEEEESEKINENENIENKEVKKTGNKMPIVHEGIIQNKSEKGITWEDRYAIITKTKFYFWYNESEKLEHKQHLGMFELKHLYNIRMLRDNEYGSKENILELKVSAYYKNDILQNGRDMTFACSDKQKLVEWFVILNFLRAKSIYDEFRCSFGIVSFPLFHEKPASEKKKKKRKFTVYKVERKSSIFNNNIFISKVSSRLIDRKYSLNKNNTTITVDRREETEEEKVLFIKEKVESLISLTWLYMVGVMQSNLINDDHKGYDEIQEPKHLIKYKKSPLIVKINNQIEQGRKERERERERDRERETEREKDDTKEDNEKKEDSITEETPINISNPINASNTIQKRDSFSKKSEESNGDITNLLPDLSYKPGIFDMDAKEKLQNLKIDLKDDLLDGQIMMLIGKK